MSEEINIITLGDIFKNIETEEKAFKFKDYITNLQQENKQLKELCNKYEEEHSTEFKIWLQEQNILRELEEWLKAFETKEFNYNFLVVRVKDIQDKIQELKERYK